MDKMRRKSNDKIPVDGELYNVDRASVDSYSVDLFYKPHTFSLLLVICTGLTLLAYYRDSNRPLADNLLAGAIVAIVVFLLISTMIMPNGIFIRPHPIIWRVIFGATLVYLILMIATCFLTLEQAREIMMWLYPDLRSLDSKAILSRDYGVNCYNFTFERISSDVDQFVIAHFLGWVVKALLLRHYVLLWVLSINWEITEIAFAHILPNLNECWWDSLILDVLICNGLGIHIGWLICKWLEMREYKWESFRAISSTKGKIKRAVLQFTPRAWTPTQWIDYDSPLKRALMLSFLMIIWQVAELNAFLLKHVFVVKPSHPLTLGRLSLVCIASAPAIRQYYQYTINPYIKRLGSQMWIFIAILVVELVIFFKLGSEHFERTILMNVVYWLIWTIFTSFLTVYFCIYLAKRSQSKKCTISQAESTEPQEVDSIKNKDL